MVNFQQLRDAKFTGLTDLVDSWSSVADSMGDARVEFSSQVNGPMGWGNWWGESADTARVRCQQLASLVNAGVTESSAIRDTLDEAVVRFTDAKKELDDVLDQLGLIPDLSVSDNGVVSVSPDVNVVAAVVWEEHRSTYQTAIDDAVTNADEADGQIAEALRFAAETDDENDVTFNGHAVDVAEMESIREDAERANELLSLDPHDLSDAELDELNSILARHSDQPIFATTLLEDMGAEGFLERAGILSFFGADIEGDARAYEVLQRNLGETLATATNPENHPSLEQEWTEELMRLGASEIEVQGAADTEMGYLALAPLLEHGEYHEEFIVPIAEHLVRLDQEMGYNWSNQDALENPFEIGGDSSSSNPLNSALIALDNNPAAATAFFAGSDAYQDFPYVDGDGRQLAPTDNNVTYLLEHANSSNPPFPIDANRLGDALETATTGVSPNDPAGIPPPVHEPRMAEIAEDFVSYFGEHPSRISPGGQLEDMADNATNIAASYMIDIHNAFQSNPNMPVDIPGNSHAEFSESASQRLLSALGQHGTPAYTLGGANEAAMAVMIHEYQPSSLDGSEWAQDAVNPGLRISGILTEGMVIGALQEGAAADQAHNDRVALLADGANHVLDQTPIGSAPISGFIVDQLVGSFSEQFMLDSREQVTFDIQEDRNQLEEYASDRAMLAITNALIAQGLSQSEVERFIEAHVGYNDLEGPFRSGSAEVINWESTD